MPAPAANNVFASNNQIMNPINHQSAQPVYVQEQTAFSHVPPFPINTNASNVIPVPVVPHGPSYLRNSVLRTSGVGHPIVQDPRFMINDTHIQRPPSLSYIDNQTSTCPVWIWALLGTLALLGIILTLVIVGKRDSSTFKITKVENVREKVPDPVAIPPNTT